jgi:hypothetical protein
MTEQRSKPDLASIEPLAPPADADQPASEPVDRVDRVGRAAAEVMGSTPAVGVTAETLDDEDPAAGSSPAVEAPERD